MPRYGHGQTHGSHPEAAQQQRMDPLGASTR